MFGKAFNRRIKKETFILEEEIQGYLDLLKEIPIEDKEKDMITSRIDEFFKIAKGIRAKDEKEDFCEASFCLTSSYDDIKGKMSKFVQENIEACN